MKKLRLLAVLFVLTSLGAMSVSWTRPSELKAVTVDSPYRVLPKCSCADAAPKIYN